MILAYRIFVNTMGIVIFTYLVHTLYNIQRDKKVLLSFVILTSIGINILFLLDKFIWMGLKALLVLIFMIFMSYYILKLKFMQSIVSNVISTIALAVGDMSVMLILVKLYGYTIEAIKTDMFLSFTADLIIYGTNLIIILIIRLISQTREMTDVYKRKVTIRTSVYMLLTFLIILINYSVSIKFIGMLDEASVLINIIIIWIYLILSLYINYTNSALALKEQQYDQQQDYIKTIDGLISDFRRLKHNHANTIYSIYGYLQEDDMKGLKAYYSELMEETGRVDNNTLLVLQKIKVYAIFGLLWSKVKEAEAVGIRITIQVSNEIHTVGVKLTALCEVMGNYLDNAIEAAVESANKIVNIIFTDDGSYLTIRIQNTFEGNPDAGKIYDKGYSTKGKGRGHGLAITKQILAQYPNLLHNTIIENKVFTQEIVIKK